MSTTQNNVTKDLLNLFWKASEIFRGVADPAEYKKYILTMLFFKYISDFWREHYDGISRQNSEDSESLRRRIEKEIIWLPEGCSFYEIYERHNEPDLGQIINIAMEKIEFANQGKLVGMFRNIDYTSEAILGHTEERNKRLQELLFLLNDPRLDLRPSRIGDMNVIGDMFISLIDKFAHFEGLRGGEYYTPQNLTSLMVELLQPEAGMSLYDPTVGAGGMLVSANKWVKNREGEEARLQLFGQDISYDAVNLTKMNLFFHQIFDGSIFLGDTLTQPQNIYQGQLLKFDLAIASPPFGVQLRTDALQKIENDPLRRFLYGIPNRSADLLFLQHIIASLKDYGRAVVVVPSGILFVSGRDGEIRRNIIEDDLIDSVVSLGPGLLTNTGIPINLIVINKSKSQERKGKILFINAAAEYEPSGRYGNIINPAQKQKIIETYYAYKPIKAFSAAIEVDQIRQNDFNLVPSRYIEVVDINNFLGGKVRWIKLSSIAEILRGSQPDHSSGLEGDVPIIRISDLSTSSINVDNLRKVSGPEEKRRIQNTQTGDILIPRIGSSLIKVCLVEENLNGVMVDHNLFIIRLYPKFQHYRRYILEFLRSDKGYSLLARYLIGAAIPQLRYVDLRDLQIPIPEESVIQLLTNIHQVENELLLRIEKAKGLRTQLFNINDSEVIQKKLDDLSTDAHILASSLVQADSLDYQIRNFYPFPLAFTYRTLSSILDPVQKYPEQLRVAENMLVFLAVIGLSISQYGGVLQSETNTDISISNIRKYFAGGISPGDWQTLAYFAGKLLRNQGNYAINESFAALWFKGSGNKESDFAKATKRLVELKNDYKHDRGPKTPHEFDLASLEIQKQIDFCYSMLSFFVRYPIRLVQSIDINWQTDEAMLDTLVYSGDHPGLRQEKISYPKALAKEMLYLEVDEDKWASLYPHMNVQYCPSCKTRETYFIDRRDGRDDRIVLKSFERGHTHESDKDAKQVGSDMELWITRYLKG